MCVFVCSTMETGFEDGSEEKQENAEFFCSEFQRCQHKGIIESIVCIHIPDPCLRRAREEPVNETMCLVYM